jgi:hypothetical protein
MIPHIPEIDGVISFATQLSVSLRHLLNLQCTRSIEPASLNDNRLDVFQLYPTSAYTLIEDCPHNESAAEPQQ